MTDREQILNTIVANKPRTIPSIVIPKFKRKTSENLIELFKQMVIYVGGRFIITNSKDIFQIIEEQYPKVETIYSCVTEISSKGVMPEKISKPHELNSVDLAVMEGTFGVAENGAIWVTEKQMGHRVLPFIAEHLVILLDRQSIVVDMHGAYDRINLSQVSYGTFISGPSKTADIEQVLVMGAQGARSHTVILTEN
jgi:L-lactate dehydrogenase complex protein LldG